MRQKSCRKSAIYNVTAGHRTEGQGLREVGTIPECSNRLFLHYSTKTSNNQYNTRIFTSTNSE